VTAYRLPTPRVGQFPEHSPVTMTTKEVVLFLEELGSVRQDLGKALARLEAFEPQFRAISEVVERVTDLERSVEICQNTCGRERRNRASVAHWIAYAVAGLIPGFLVWCLQHFSH
jgi:hypothetical protein